MNPLASAYWTAKGVGWDNVPRRLLQAYRVRSGWLRRRVAAEHFSYSHFPLASVDDTARTAQWQERRKHFFAMPAAASLKAKLPESAAQTDLFQPARSLLAGNYPMFSHWTSSLGWPPDFNRDATHEIDWPVGESWLSTARSGPPRNDIKLVWEPSRLTAAFLLARAYRYDGDTLWAEAFWQLIEGWIDQNPPNLSVAWGCGQETAFRLMASLFGAFAVLDSKVTTPLRLQQIDLLAWRSGKRIAANINYAISQENNHALSEAAGLFTVGVLYHQLPKARVWLEAGKQVIEREIRRQIYDDGSYVQHSMSYHRVMLDDMIWAVRLAKINGIDFAPDVVDRVRLSIRWLDQFVNGGSGRVPNLGANDGANVLPLSATDYLDYRPVLDTAAAVFEVPVQSFGNGPWQEKRVWICGSDSPPAKSPPSCATHWRASVGGYHLLRRPDGYLMLKGATYRDRPGQCDTLHLDVWHRGVNILRDSGSFRYYHEDSKLKSHFYSVAAHNTVQVGGQEQMVKGPRFLWYRWPSVQCHQSDAEGIDLEATFSTVVPYRHRRQVDLVDSGWNVKDTVVGKNGVAPAAGFVARWHLSPEGDWEISQADGAIKVVSCIHRFELRFTAASSFEVSVEEGQESLYYGVRQTVPVVVVRVAGQELSTRLMGRENPKAEAC